MVSIMANHKLAVTAGSKFLHKKNLTPGQQTIKLWGYNGVINMQERFWVISHIEALYKYSITLHSNKGRLFWIIDIKNTGIRYDTIDSKTAKR